MTPSIGWSKFASDRHVEGSGNSFFTISKEEVIERVKKHWAFRIAGHGETGLDRKVVVPVEAEGFFLSSTPLVEGLPIRAAVTRRQDGEDWFVETYVEAEDAKQLGINYEPASFVRIVCYSDEALRENNGERTTDDDWEIVAVLASQNDGSEPMTPLTMARNFLEMPGGTKSVYTAQEFAESIYFHSKRSVKIKKVPQDISPKGRLVFASAMLHVIGNAAFAIETNLDPLRKRINAGQTAAAAEIIDDIESSIEKIKIFLTAKGENNA